MLGVKIKDLKKDDVVWECAQIGGSIKVRIMETPNHEDGKWTFRGMTPGGIQNYLATDGYMHYGPKFYKEPIYFPIDEREPKEVEDEN